MYVDAKKHHVSGEDQKLISVIEAWLAENQETDDGTPGLENKVAQEFIKTFGDHVGILPFDFDPQRTDLIDPSKGVRVTLIGKGEYKVEIHYGVKSGRPPLAHAAAAASPAPARSRKVAPNGEEKE